MVDEQSARQGEYVVVARRYRPQRFEELIGQEHVARALTNAIATNRVGHAYLFTGARGVGKTSAARIFAKALDCEHGPTPTPCNQCEICQSISAGGDVDVLEMDGASNRGIDQIRDLRQNVAVRPSRARFKIYIIDEVHMLTKEAFNALLKTLEEPPEHVKFLFCTTEAEKIPITILSRCQRFDFAGVQTTSIAERLAQIAKAESVEAEPEALEILARRAAGSMRDSQSLLEQLLSFGGNQITVANVHEMLGTAADGRLGQLVKHLVSRDAAASLAALDAAVAEGVEVGQLVVQLLGYMRDVMAASVGCSPESFLNAARSEHAAIADASRQWGLQAVLAAMQILDQTDSRLARSMSPRTLVELALVRICALEDLQRIPELLAQLQSGSLATASTVAPTPGRAYAEPLSKKKYEELNPVEVTPASTAASSDIEAVIPTQPALPLTNESVQTVWRKILDQMADLTADNAAIADSVAISGPNRLAVSFAAKYDSCKAFCERPERSAVLEQALSAAFGQPIRLEFRVLADSPVKEAEPAPRRPASNRSKLIEKAQNPLVRRAEELFKATPVAIEDS